MNGLSVGNIKKQVLSKENLFFYTGRFAGGRRKMIAGKVALRRGRR